VRSKEKRERVLFGFVKTRVVKREKEVEKEREGRRDARLPLPSPRAIYLITPPESIELNSLACCIPDRAAEPVVEIAFASFRR